MKQLCILSASAIAGYAGWGLAAAIGLGVFAAFLISGVASLVGVYVGWKISRRLE